MMYEIWRKPKLTLVPTQGIFKLPHLLLHECALSQVSVRHIHSIDLAFKALDDAQASYAVIVKELLAIYFGCPKLHNYIFRQKITVHPDHKPLVVTMNKPLHKLSARMQRKRMHLQKL